MNIYSSAKDAANRTQAVIEKVCEDVFLLQERETTVSLEVSSGIIQFVSCLYILPVLPGCIEDAGYDTEHIIVVISYLCFGGCILSGFLTNLPFVVAPPAAVSIFLAVTLAEKHISISEGSIGVIISGTLLLLAGIFPPILILLANVISCSFTCCAFHLSDINLLNARLVNTR